MNLLEVSEVSKRFSGLVALDKLSFAVGEKEILGLIGPNGAGKTTLFNVIAGSLRPSSGKIYLDGRDVTGLPPNRICRLGLARTYQVPKPFSDLTVIENIEMAEAFGGSSAAGRKKLGTPDEICDMVGLTGKKDALARILSVSEKKRLEVGRAVATSPKLLLLDESAAGLNSQEGEWFSSFGKRMRDDWGLSMIWIEHVMRLLMRSVDRVVVLDHGVKIGEGLPAEIVKDKRVLQAYLGGGGPEG
jgi:branched-chain amino acid transport system ATP-binding protein